MRKMKNGNAALSLALDGGHAETANALRAAGANVNARDKDGDTALSLATENGHTETANALRRAEAGEFS